MAGCFAESGKSTNRRGTAGLKLLVPAQHKVRMASTQPRRFGNQRLRHHQERRECVAMTQLIEQLAIHPFIVGG